MQELPPPPTITDYERERAVNVSLNDQVYKILGLPTLATSLRNEMKKSKGKEKIQEEGSEYDPGEEEHNGDDPVVKPRKVILIFILVL